MHWGLSGWHDRAYINAAFISEHLPFFCINRCPNMARAPICPLIPDVAFVSQRGPPDVPTTSPEPVFRPESLSDGPGAGRRPPEAENDENPSVAVFFASP